MKRFFALAALVLGLAACQTEPEGLDVNVGGEVDTTITVSLPETTRATDSAEGAFENVDLSGDATIRYILKIYQKVGNEYVASNDRQVEYSDGKSVVFPVRLVPNRDYRFVVWADYVEGEADVDYHYNTADLTNIELMGEWKPMDETRDAFTGVYCTVKEGKQYTGTSSINIPLKRPFAKLRVITTDMVELGYLGINPTHATVEYATPYRASFNALESVAVAAVDSNVKSHGVFEIAAYDADNTDANKVLFTDYFFAEQDVVKFTLSVYEDAAMTKPIKSNFFNTDISVNRNYLTTIKGNILTDGNKIEVNVEDAFEGTENWPNENESAEQLAYAAMFGGEVTLTEDVVLTQPLTIVEGANVVINLNGKTINAGLKQESRHHYAIDNYGTLTLKGNGFINARGVENFGTMTVEEGVTITNVDTNGGAAIWNEGNLTINGGTFKTNESAGIGSYGAALNTRPGGKAVVNGGTFEAHSQLTYAIINEGETTINNADVKGKHGVVAGAETNDHTAIYGGTFKLNGNPDNSDHCTYYVSAIYGGTFSIVPDPAHGDLVFYASTIAASYKAVEVNGKYVVVPEEVDSVATDTSVVDAIKGDNNKNATVYVMPKEDGSDILLEGKLSMAEGVKLIGMGDTPVALFNDWGSNAFANQAHFTNTHVENINFTNNLVIDAGIANGDVKFVNCVFGGDRAHQGVHFDSGNGTITFENCTFVGRNMFGASLEKVIFNNCTFLNKKSSLTGADKWTGVNMWGNYEFNNCTFDTEAHCNVKCEGVIAAFNNCKYVDGRNIQTIINNSNNFTATITF